MKKQKCYMLRIKNNIEIRNKQTLYVYLQKNQALLAASLDSVMKRPMALGVTFLLLGLIQMWPPSYFLKSPVRRVTH